MTKNIAFALLSLVIIGAILISAEYFSLRKFGFEASALNSGYARVALLTLMTYVGIMSQVLVARLKKSTDDKINIIREVFSSMQSREFWLAILASPFVLFAAYNAIDQITSFALVGAIGFQNGYFFHSILSREQARVSE